MDQNRLLRNESTHLRSAEYQQCQEHTAERGQMGASVRGAGKTRYSQAQRNKTLTLLRCKNQHESDLNTKAAGRKQGDTSSHWIASGSEVKIKVSKFLSEDWGRITSKVIWVLVELSSSWLRVLFPWLLVTRAYLQLLEAAYLPHPHLQNSSSVLCPALTWNLSLCPLKVAGEGAMFLSAAIRPERPATK